MEPSVSKPFPCCFSLNLVLTCSDFSLSLRWPRLSSSTAALNFFSFAGSCHRPREAGRGREPGRLERRFDAFCEKISAVPRPGQHQEDKLEILFLWAVAWAWHGHGQLLQLKYFGRWRFSSSAEGGIHKKPAWWRFSRVIVMMSNTNQHMHPW